MIKRKEKNLNIPRTGESPLEEHSSRKDPGFSVQWQKEKDQGMFFGEQGIHIDK